MEKKVLIVDDEEDIRVLADHLMCSHCLLDSAKNGDECLHAIKKKDYHLIILDIMMPGLPVTEIIKILEKKKRKPKVVYYSVIGKEKAKELGLMKPKIIKGFIEKPISNEDFVKEAMKYLK